MNIIGRTIALLKFDLKFDCKTFLILLEKTAHIKIYKNI